MILDAWIKEEAKDKVDLMIKKGSDSVRKST